MLIIDMINAYTNSATPTYVAVNAIEVQIRKSPDTSSEKMPSWGCQQPSWVGIQMVP